MKLVKLENIAQISAGQGAPQGDHCYCNDGLPFIKAGDLKNLIITNNEYKSCKLVNKETVKKYKLKLYPKNTIVFAKSGMSATKGRIYCLNNESYVVNHLSIITPNTDFIEPGYLKYFFKVFPPSRLIKDESYPSISLGDIKKIKTPLPPLETQKRIVKILNKVDVLRQKRKQAINLLDNYLKSVFLEMFGDPVTNPKGWNIITLQHVISDVKNGITRRRKEFENKGSIVLRLKDIRENKIDYFDNNRITLDISEKEKFKVDVGDLLFIRVNGNPDYVGRSAVFDGYHEDVYFNDHIMRVRINRDQINEYFLCSFINSVFGKRQISLYKKTSAGQHTINQQGLNKIKICLPPIKLQNKFAEILKRDSTLKQKMLVQLEELETQFQALMQKAFKGEL